MSCPQFFSLPYVCVNLSISVWEKLLTENLSGLCVHFISCSTCVHVCPLCVSDNYMYLFGPKPKSCSPRFLPGFSLAFNIQTMEVFLNCFNGVVWFCPLPSLPQLTMTLPPAGPLHVHPLPALPPTSCFEKIVTLPRLKYGLEISYSPPYHSTVPPIFYMERYFNFSK